MELHTIGIDLGKTVFHLAGLNLRGEVVVRKKFSRKQLLHFTANLQVELIGMEACGGSHFLGRALREQGHEVRLMPAQYVKPYVKTNKSDVLLLQLKLELDHLQMRIDEADAMINKTADENEACRRLVAIPGIGPVTATAIIAAIGNGAAFKKGRGFSAWLGIVPGEYTTGGKQKLLGISKRGNSYLRRLFVQGARAVLQQSAKQSSGLRTWLAQLTTRTHSNVAVVALANKLARMAWAVLAKNEPYRPPIAVGAATT
jgi:transposase